MGEVGRRYLQELIIAELAVPASFDAATDVADRIQFLTDRITRTGASGLVLGISGGVDSTVAGRLSQLAVERVRIDGGDATFLAVRLPYGTQHDETDARRALEFIRPDEVCTVDVRAASDAMLESLREGGLRLAEPDKEDSLLGNIKARQRMIAQYALAGARGALVVGADHAAEAVMGFYTKYGDGACDLTPLAGLTKRRVRALAAALGADPALAQKVATADLESNSPGQPDEQAFGMSYDEIDDFLEGLDVTPETHETIVAWHRSTAHKRAMPLGFTG